MPIDIFYIWASLVVEQSKIEIRAKLFRALLFMLILYAFAAILLVSLKIKYFLPLLIIVFFKMTLVNRPALGTFPSKDFPDLIQKTLVDAAPPGLHQVVTMACGTCANENAYKTAFFWYMRKQRGHEIPSPDDPAFHSCMINQVISD